jgi:hypothetical protein
MEEESINFEKRQRMEDLKERMRQLEETFRIMEEEEKK